MKVDAFNVMDFGASGDGRTLDTVAIQKAVDSCAAAGGGRVVVPAGTFVSGPVFLKSNIEFHLSAGAVLQADPDMKAYGQVDLKTHGHHINAFQASLITAVQAENVSVTGHGTLDGQGKVWWDEIDAGRGGPRPVLVYFLDCERVLLEGVKLLNSPAWTVLPLLCRNVDIRGIYIKNPWKPYHNCDGIDIHACREVRISDCHIDTGDDGICLKSIPDWFISACGTSAGHPTMKVDYNLPRVPCENVTIENCTVIHAHSGVAIWAEVIGGMSNVVVTNCVFDGTRQGIWINRYPWPGGYVKDVRVDNIVMRRVEIVMAITSYHDPEKVEEGPGKEDTPEFSNIHISNLTATKARLACEVYGLPKMPVRDISFSNIRIEADKGFDIRDAENILLDNVEVTCPGPAVLAENVRDLELRRVVAKSTQTGIPAIQIANTQDTWIHGCRAVMGTDVFLGQVGEENRNLVLEGNQLSQAAYASKDVKPVPVWSFSSFAYSGSAMWRTSGDENPFLPVPPAVEATIRREWDADRINWINGLFRLESGGRSDVELPAGDKRRIYITEAWGVSEKLIICEDGELLRKIDDPQWRAWGKE